MLPKTLALLASLALAAWPTASPAAPAAAKTLELTVTSEGFVPAKLRVKAGDRVRLLVTRKTDRTCATEIVIKELGINQPLPLDRQVAVEFTPKKSGVLRYACGMDMISGVLVVE
jgi:plastocyanin domain-containing protein